MIAILEDAVDCIGKYGRPCDANRRRQFEAALEWVLSESNLQPFTFEWICDVLGLDATYLRRGLSVAVRSGWGHSTAGRATAVTSDATRAELRTWSIELTRLLHRGQHPSSHAR